MTGCSPRLKTYTLSLASTPTAPTSLNDQPSGNFAQSSTMRYLKSPLPTMIDITLSRIFCVRPRRRYRTPRGEAIAVGQCFSWDCPQPATGGRPRADLAHQGRETHMTGVDLPVVRLAFPPARKRAPDLHSAQ